MHAWYLLKIVMNNEGGREWPKSPPMGVWISRFITTGSDLSADAIAVMFIYGFSNFNEEMTVIMHECRQREFHIIPPIFMPVLAPFGHMFMDISANL